MKIRLIAGRTIEVTNISDISFEITCEGRLYLFPTRKTVRFSVPKEGGLVVENCFVGLNRKLTIPFELWFTLF